MKGHNKLVINASTLKEILELWVNKSIPKEKIEVTDVEYVKGSSFIEIGLLSPMVNDNVNTIGELFDIMGNANKDEYSSGEISNANLHDELLKFRDSPSVASDFKSDVTLARIKNRLANVISKFSQDEYSAGNISPKDWEDLMLSLRMMRSTLDEYIG
jgi:hypothetical protein